MGVSNSRLMTAVVEQDLEFLKKWITPENVNAITPINGSKMSLLTMACSVIHINCNPEIVKFLIERGADVNQPYNTNMSTPLLIASDQGILDVCRLLIQNDANVNHVRCDGMSALMLASQQGHLDICRLLLQYKANVNHKSNNGLTPLYMACVNSRYQIAELFLKCGADPNIPGYDGIPSLIITSQFNVFHIVELLLDYGADPTMVDNNGKSLLYWVVHHGNMPIFKRIAENWTVDELTLLVEECCRYGRLEILKLLLERGAQCNDINFFSLACKGGHIDIVKFLADRGFKPTDADMKLLRAYPEIYNLYNPVVDTKTDILTIQCVICYDNQRNIAFGCGHAVVCMECSLELEKCPMCREQIKNRIRIIL